MTEEYLGYEISWQEPPATSAGYDMNIASRDAQLQRILEQHYGCRGALVLKVPGSLAQAKELAHGRIEAALEAARDK